MQLKNDYDKNVFNGDVGLVTVIDQHDGLLVVQFGDQAVTYAFHELDALALAYAVSIHRAQGSEYPVVVLPLVMQHAMLLQRNLLYTAITRAKKLCVIVGEERALRYAIHNDEVAARNTALAERLRPTAAPSPAAREGGASATDEGHRTTNGAQGIVVANEMPRREKTGGDSRKRPNLGAESDHS